MNRTLERIFVRSAVTVLVCSIALTSCAQNKAQNERWTLAPFLRPVSPQPVISPNEESTFLDPMNGKIIYWEANDTFNPAAVIKGDSVYVLYRAEDKSGVGIGERTSRLGLASSVDGFQMKTYPQPILYPGDDSQKDFEWPGGCEDPRVAVTEDGTYIMLYTQWNKKVPRLAVATSKDLLIWEKYGSVFRKAYDGKFFDIPSKSASIVTGLKGNKQVITKVNGKYLMYWGEKFINLATSDDLINWTPEVDANGDLVPIVSPREGYFDSQLTECGPPAVLTKDGIVLLYNGKNEPGKKGDENYTANTYAAGQILFDRKRPGRVLARLDQPFFVPQESFEKSGQYPAGTVFVEGLVYFKNRWFLYYGGADSKVGVATYQPKN